jgi:osmotically-inducible protein OsmY
MKKITIILSLLFLSSCVESAVIGAVGATGTMIAQDRTSGQAFDDTAIFWKIKTAYTKADAYDLLTGVNIEVIEGRVYLTGKVPSPETRVEAVTIAWKPNGVQEVINEIVISDEKSLATGLQNKWTTTRAASALTFERGVKSLNYSVEAIDGVIYLMGIAQNQDELDRATNVLSRIGGVQKVISHVRVKETPYITE